MQLEKTKEGYTNPKSGACYVALDPAYQPATRGEAAAEYYNAERDVKRMFYELPGLDVSQYLADEYGNVYCAGEILPNAALWQLTAVLVCEEENKSFERCRLSVGSDDAEIEALRVLWFGDTEKAELPLGAPQHTFQIKLCGEEYPMLYYNFTMQIYAGGEAYFHDDFNDRTVLLPRELAAKLCPEGTLPEVTA